MKENRTTSNPLRIGAVITAAGMSTRMGDFKQLMQIGGLSMAERVVINFQRAGVRDIVMVTGYRAEEVEKALSRRGVTFLRNADYAATEMFDSVKIGLSYLRDFCDRVFLCPVDIPFFREKTVEEEMRCDADVVIPVTEGHKGHPILIASSLIDDILAYQGDDGLRGALGEFRSVTSYLDVEDEGSLVDADTQEKYQQLVEIHNRHLLHPEAALKLSNADSFFDAGTVLLLKQVDRLGNVREACERIGISYSKGWNVIHTVEKGLGCRIVDRRAGGIDGGSASITERGRRLIRLYEELEQDINEFVKKRFAEIFSERDLF